MSKFFAWWYDTAIGTNHPDTEDYVLGIVLSLAVALIVLMVSVLLLCLVIASKGIILIPVGIIAALVYGLVLEGRKRRG